MDAKLKMLRIYNDSELFKKAHEDDAGYDIYAHHFTGLSDDPYDEVTLYENSTVKVHTGIKCAIDKNHFMWIVPRSGLSAKNNLIIPNTPGTIDNNYRGELIVTLTKVTPGMITLRAGDRIAQAIIIDQVKVDVEEVYSDEALGFTDRGEGAFGSTGTK